MTTEDINQNSSPSSDDKAEIVFDLAESRENPKTTYLSKEYEKIVDQENQTEEMSLNDPAMKELAEEELANLDLQKQALAKQIKEILDSVIADEKEFPNEIILEIRAGAGGDEASLFAYNLAEMYEKYADSNNWKFRKLNESLNSTGGYKEVSFEVKGQGVYEKMRFETGVHRVQRVPVTEKIGRIHTSTASVAIMPIKKHSLIVIKPDDLEMEFSRSGGAGGQSVNKTSSAVRLIHRPSNIMVRVSQERKQLQNRQIALDLLRGQLWEIEEEKRLAKLGNARAAIGRNMRAEKIRTFNYPQNRVTDHRINHSWHQLENIIEGDLDPVISTIKQELAKTNKN